MLMEPGINSQFVHQYQHGRNAFLVINEFAEIHMPLPLNITDDAELKCLLQRLSDDIIEYQYQFI
jgi:hypothetical protein